MADDDYSNALASSDRPQGLAASTSGGGNYDGMAATAIGGASKAFSLYQSGRINRRIARYNADRARVQADQALQAGDFAARRRQMVQQQLTGATIAAQAAGGTVVGAGTSALVTKGQENASAMDQFLIRLNASRTAGGYLEKAAGEDLQGDMAMRAGESDAIGSLLGTGSKEWLMADASHDPQMGLAIGGGE